MSNDKKKNISDELKQKRRELKQLESQADMKKAKRTANAMTKIIGDSAYVCKSLRGYTAEEGEIIARHVVAYFDTIVRLSMNDIIDYREKSGSKLKSRHLGYLGHMLVLKCSSVDRR